MYENFLHKLFYSDPLPGPEEDNIIIGYPEVNTVAPRLPPLPSQDVQPFVPRKKLQNFALDLAARERRGRASDSSLSRSTPEGSEMDAEAKARLYMTAIREANRMNRKPSAALAFGKYKTTEIGRRMVEDLMKDYGISRKLAAGMVGNLDYETAGFSTLQEIAPLVAGSRGGLGYAQWTGDRRDEFEAFARDTTSYEDNYGFLRHELDNTREGRFLKKYRDTTSVEDAARMFSEKYLRPSKKHANMEERIRRAIAYSLENEE